MFLWWRLSSCLPSVFIFTFKFPLNITKRIKSSMSFCFWSTAGFRRIHLASLPMLSLRLQKTNLCSFLPPFYQAMALLALCCPLLVPFCICVPFLLALSLSLLNRCSGWGRTPGTPVTLHPSSMEDRFLLLLPAGPQRPTLKVHEPCPLNQFMIQVFFCNLILIWMSGPLRPRQLSTCAIKSLFSQHSDSPLTDGFIKWSWGHFNCKERLRT